MPRSVLFVHEVEAIGGAERYLESLAGGMQRRGMEVSAVLYGIDDESGRMLANRLAASARNVWYKPGHSRARDVRRFMRSADADVLHWNMTYPFAYRGALVPALDWGVPSVITDHLPGVPGGPHSVLARRIANRFLDAVIVVSESAHSEARARWGRVPPLFVVRNGVPRADQRRRSGPGPESRLRLILVGRLEEQKNPFFALRVVGALRARGVDARLRLVGVGSLAHAIVRCAAENGIAESIELAGFREDPLPELLDAHLLLAPSTFEGFPFAPLEALATGMPVLLSDIPPHREIAAATAAARIVPLGDAERWADEVGDMAGDLEQLSEAAIADAYAFSAERMVDDTLAVYERARQR
jgi:glycosyltransferase involved in cell wall biosynthesis